MGELVDKDCTRKEDLRKSLSSALAAKVLLVAKEVGRKAARLRAAKAVRRAMADMMGWVRVRVVAERSGEERRGNGEEEEVTRAPELADARDEVKVMGEGELGGRSFHLVLSPPAAL
ncbi:hypothetical protein KC364_g66 [Hortaea werneckii]|nr:hypothetical protein KC364_g66 [Hortaea werneckii]